MTANPLVLRSELIEGGHPVTRARLVSSNGVLLTAADFTGTGAVITYTVYDEQAADPTVPVVATTVLTAGAVISGLSTTGWTKDSTGYNFSHKVTDAAVCAEGGHTYRIEYLLAQNTNPGNDGDVIGVVHRVDCRGVQAA